MNRRQFVCTATAAFAGIPAVLAAGKYDLIIKGGRVIDPSRKLDAIRDVAIANGRIVAIEANIAAGAGETIDARGKLVVPGLIDIHTHAARVSGWAGAVPGRRRDGADRCGIARRGSHWRNDRDRQIGAATVPRSDQHRACRDPAGRRHHGPQAAPMSAPRAKPSGATAT